VQCPGRTSACNWSIWNIFQWWVDCCWTKIPVIWDVMQCHLVNTSRHNVTSHKTWIFSSTTVRNSDMACCPLRLHTDLSRYAHHHTHNEQSSWLKCSMRPTKLVSVSFMYGSASLLCFTFRSILSPFIYKHYRNHSFCNHILYILKSNPHPFYSFRGLKNQMRIRFACGLDSQSRAGFWKNDWAAVRAVRTIQYSNLLFYYLLL
jgi:hypothetical protein